MTQSLPPSGRILCVCTANICRSAMTEQLLLDGLRRRVPSRTTELEVVSAGTRAIEGLPMAEDAVVALGERHVEVAAFASRALTVEQIAGADVVLCATREHRAAVVALDPTASRRAFTTLEFAFLIGDVLPADARLPDGADLGIRLRALVKLVSGSRGLRRPDHPDDFDLDDPYGQKLKAFRQTGGLLDDALRRPLDLVTQQSAEPTAPAVARRSWWR